MELHVLSNLAIYSGMIAFASLMIGFCILMLNIFVWDNIKLNLVGVILLVVGAGQFIIVTLMETL